MAGGGKSNKRPKIAKVDRIDFDKKINQEQFAMMIGISQQDVSRLFQYCVLSPNGTAKDWSREYIRFMMGVIYANHGWRGLARLYGD